MMNTSTLPLFAAPASGSKARRLVLSVLIILVCSFTTRAQLSGVYTVDASKAATATNYASVASVVFDLQYGKRADTGVANGPGVNGGVIVKIADGTYNDRLDIGAISGVSSNNTITFLSASGKAEKVKLIASTVSTINFSHVLRISGSRYISFNNVTFQMADMFSSARLIQLDGNTNYITLSGCRFVGHGKTDGLYMEYPIGNALHHITVEANEFSNCTYGVNGSQPADSNTISTGQYYYGNSFKNVQNGINLVQTTGLIIDKNTIYNEATSGWSYGTGINLVNCMNIDQITGNTIYMGHYCNGIRLKKIFNDGQLFTTIANNRITIAGEAAGAGLHIANSNNFLVAHNSMWLKDSLSGQPDLITRAVYLSRAFIWEKGTSSSLNATLHFNDNCLANLRGAALALDATSGKIDMDHNNYYAKGSYFAILAGDSLASFAKWKTRSGYDAKSLDANPEYVADNDLHVKNTSLNAGKYISSIAYDIDGESRNTTNPTIGADEIGHSGEVKAEIGYSKNLCAGNNIEFSDKSTTTCGDVTGWLWDLGDGSTGATTRNVKHQYTSAGSYTVKLAVITKDSCTDSTSVVIKISNDCVWPGDANASKKVTLTDVLAIGVAYNDTGAVRANATTNWVGQPTDKWAKAFASGVNHKHADCNGDGKVDSDDLKAVALNYGKTHLKKDEKPAATLGAPQLLFEFPTDTLYAGKAYKVKIKLGDASNTASDVYGLEFNFEYESELLDSSGFTLSVVNSWLTGSDNNKLIYMLMPNYSNHSVDLAISRTNQKNASGYGTIGELGIVIKDDVAGKNLLSKDLNLKFRSYSAISANESAISLDATDGSAKIYYEASGIRGDSPGTDIQIYPNPSEGRFGIDAGNAKVTSVIVSNVIGQRVWANMNPQSGIIYTDLTGLGKGLYYVQVITNSGQIVKAIEIK